jgi:uncharacterized repeat protein (TIGR03803 family)
MLTLRQAIPAAGMLFLAFATHCAAQAPPPVFTTLYQFQGGNDGSEPFAPVVIGAGGILYGTTLHGGSSQDTGTIFSLTPPASPGGSWTEAVLHSFGAGSDGFSPHGLAIDRNGVLYGTTQGGGASQVGTVYSLTPPLSPGGVWTETILHSFHGGADGDGGDPIGIPVIGSGRVLYGTTRVGGAYGHGTAFALTPAAGGLWTETVLYSFGAAGSDGGAYPLAGLAMGSGGVLYGTTSGGAPPATEGTVFSLTPPAAPGSPWTETTLYVFSGGADGGSPYYGRLAIDSSGVLYGTTLRGGTNNLGVAFSLTPPAVPGGTWSEAALYNFSHNSGQKPETGLVLSGAGKLLYGTTPNGGTTPGATGTVFQLTPPASPGGAWTYTELHSFPASQHAFPAAAVTIGSGGVIYGTTSGCCVSGAPANGGTVFSVAR